MRCRGDRWRWHETTAAVVGEIASWSPAPPWASEPALGRDGGRQRQHRRGGDRGAKKRGSRWAIWRSASACASLASILI
jgi:hypothetical protein